MAMRKNFIPSRLCEQLRMLLHDRRGGPAMEFAIIAPILAVAMISVYDLGAALQQYIRLSEAVRAGGTYAVAHPVADTTQTSDAAAVNSTAIAAAVTNAVPDWTLSATPTVTMACYCSNSTTALASCTQASAASCPSAELRRYITITASKAFTPVLLSNLTTVSYTHVVRYQ